MLRARMLSDFVPASLQTAVAQEFATRYCPHSRAVFLARLAACATVFVVAALAFLLGGKYTVKRGLVASPYRAVAYALLAFTLGSVALVLYGLSGCSGPAAEGLIWDWP